MPAIQSKALATLNDRTITLDDIDPNVRDLANRLDGEIALARNRVLAEQIDALLFEAEAGRRRITVSRLFEIEVKQRTVDPTTEEIQAIYDANRAQFGSSDLTTARPQIVAYLRRESEQKLIADLALRLRKRFPVVMGANVNTQGLSASMILATVAGRTVTAGALLERLKPIIYDLQLRVYEAVRSAVDQLIYDLLVIAEARKRGVGPEAIIRKEVTEKGHAPTEEEITRFFDENKARLNVDLAKARGSIVSYLEQQEQARLEQALSDKLRQGATVRMFIQEPEPPVLAISTDDDPSRGLASAPVTVVVFTDFQCPNCGLNHPMIDEVTRSYGNSVRLVIRDFPLDMHENALKAAEAANAAYAQGKFFEYMELLFKNQQALDVPSLKKYATEIGLNRAKFDAALAQGTYASEVGHDIADGVQYGVLGTPTVFVNGVRVNKLSSETLRAAIDRALAKKKAS
jgi:protein-disulfide isomerase